ncbi:MAG: hypothetical protein H6Q20_1647 [Bacteroidetes bacterium]|nr:hypothetical protein [Bacteroidota bacterium]
MIKITSTLLLILLISFQTFLSAQTSVADSALDKRIDYIQQALEQVAPTVSCWWYGWLGAYSAATGVQAAIGFTTDNKVLKQDMLLGSVTTLLGAGLQALTPMNTGSAAKQITQLPDSTPEQKIYKLQKAEELFEAAARTEKNGRSWKIHALNSAVNLGSGLVTWLGYKRSVWDGVSNFLINSAISELQIWTQPTRTLRNYRKYCRQFNPDSVSVAQNTMPEYFLRSYPGGVSFTIVF